MQLWTWQNPELLIYDELTKYDSLKYSPYLNDKYIAASERHRFLEAYKKLGSILEEDQLLWCYMEENEAVSQASIVEYEGKKLWRLNVPEEDVRIVCSIAWQWILYNRESCLGNFEALYDKLKRMLPRLTREEFSDVFHAYWRKKEPSELWKDLFLPDAEACVRRCPTAIVMFPVKKEWVV